MRRRLKTCEAHGGVLVTSSSLFRQFHAFHAQGIPTTHHIQGLATHASYILGDIILMVPRVDDGFASTTPRFT